MEQIEIIVSTLGLYAVLFERIVQFIKSKTGLTGTPVMALVVICGVLFGLGYYVYDPSLGAWYLYAVAGLFYGLASTGWHEAISAIKAGYAFVKALIEAKKAV